MKPGLLIRPSTWSLLSERYAGSSLWMLADQGVVSGTSFFSSFVVARTCSKVEFGAYVLAVSIQLALREVQVGLVTSPLAFLGSTRTDRQFSAYLTPLIPFQVMTALLVSLFAWAVSYVYLAAQVSRDFAGVAGAAALALFVVQSQEFFRRTLMTRLMFRTALINDLVFCILQVGTLSLILTFGKNLGVVVTPLLVFQTTAFSGLAASAFGYRQITRLTLGRPRWDWEIVKENWSFGKWNLATSLLVALYQQAVYLTLGSLIGPAAVATIEAPRLLVAPFTVLLQGWNNWMGPSAGRLLASRGLRATQAFLNRMTGMLTGAISLVLLPLVFFPTSAVGKLLGPRYADTPWILRMWAGCILCMVISSCVPCILFLARLPQKLTLIRMISSFIGLPVMVILIFLFGASGAVGSRLVVEVVQAAGAVIITRRFLLAQSDDTPSLARLAATPEC